MSTSTLLRLCSRRAGDLDRAGGFPARLRNGDAFSSGEIIARQGAGRARVTQHLVQRAVENQFAALFAASGTDVDQMIGRTDDRFLMLDHEQRVAFVAQIMNDANQPADIARMQTDARLIHDEKRVHERSAETGREIHPLHFAAAQSARGAIERQIAQPDIAEIRQPRDHFPPQHLRCGVVRRKRDAGEHFARARNRKRRDLAVKSAAFRAICRSPRKAAA